MVARKNRNLCTVGFVEEPTMIREKPKNASEATVGRTDEAGGEVRMSYYGNNDKDNLLFVIKQFLKEHPVSELLEVVADAAEAKEEGWLD